MRCFSHVLKVCSRAKCPSGSCDFFKPLGSFSVSIMPCRTVILTMHVHVTCHVSAAALLQAKLKLSK
eukprot:1488729-Amphidinium_carterae.2